MNRTVELTYGRTGQVVEFYPPESVRDALGIPSSVTCSVFDGNRCVLCGGCADVCPTMCLKLVPLDALSPTPELGRAIDRSLGSDAGPGGHSAILKDEERCIRCALCAMRCPADAIAMERVTFSTEWSAS